jgi:hypothetical protein
VPVHIREKAVRYARMEGVTMAEWLAKAVETQAEKQEGNQVIPPGQPKPTVLPSLTVDLSDAAAALQAMATAASAGLPISKTAVRDTVALIRDHIRVGRGLPPRQTSQQIGQTMRLNHARSEVNGKDPLPTAVDTEDAGSPIAQAAGIND